MPDTRYTCHRTRTPLQIDGRLVKPAWQLVRTSPRFVDMVTGDPGYFDTRAAALWDDQNFYVAFWIEEPFVEARLTERDSLIFNENDVELLVAAAFGIAVGDAHPRLREAADWACAGPSEEGVASVMEAYLDVDSDA